jgi:hypothetical protein
MAKKKELGERIKSEIEQGLDPETSKDEQIIEIDANILKDKIKFLEEELVRKHKVIEELEKENKILFKTALKNSENKVNSKQ